MKRKSFVSAAWVIGAVGLGLFLSLGPWQAFNRQRQIADEKLAEKERAERNLVELTETKARLESPAGRERRAREQGFGKPTERPAGSQ